MSNMLRTPSLGPIVGHTTTTTVRVWMRGSDETDGRTVGVAVLCDAKGRPKKDTAQYVRLHREHDRTGTVDFDGLEAGTAYSVRLGSLTLDSTDDREHVATDDLGKRRASPSSPRFRLTQARGCPSSLAPAAIPVCCGRQKKPTASTAPSSRNFKQVATPRRVSCSWWATRFTPTR